MKTAAEKVSHQSSTRAASDSEGATDLLKGLSPATANQTAFFFRSIVRLGLLAVAVSVVPWVDAIDKLFSYGNEPYLARPGERGQTPVH